MDVALLKVRGAMEDGLAVVLTPLRSGGKVYVDGATGVQPVQYPCVLPPASATETITRKRPLLCAVCGGKPLALYCRACDDKGWTMVTETVVVRR